MGVGNKIERENGRGKKFGDHRDKRKREKLGEEGNHVARPVRTRPARRNPGVCDPRTTNLSGGPTGSVFSFCLISPF